MSPDPVGADSRILVGGGDGGRSRLPDPVGTGCSNPVEVMRIFAD